MGLILLVIAGVLLGSLVGFIIGLIINLIRLVFLCLWWLVTWAMDLGRRESHIVIKLDDWEDDEPPMRDVTPVVRRLPSPSRRTGTTLSGPHRRQGHAHYPSSSNWSSRGRA
jgi:hypothetical protein